MKLMRDIKSCYKRPTIPYNGTVVNGTADQRKFWDHHFNLTSEPRGIRSNMAGGG